MTLTLSATFSPRRATLRLLGAIDADHEHLHRRLDDALGLSCDVEVDARAVAAIDHASLLLLADTAERLRAAHHALVVFAPSLPFRRAALSAGLAALLSDATEEQAVPTAPTRLR